MKKNKKIGVNVRKYLISKLIKHKTSRSQHAVFKKSTKPNIVTQTLNGP